MMMTPKGPKDEHVRGGKFFHGGFRWAANQISSNSPRRHSKKNSPPVDELDGTLKKGVEKGQSPDAKRHLNQRTLNSYAQATNKNHFHRRVESHEDGLHRLAVWDDDGNGASGVGERAQSMGNFHPAPHQIQAGTTTTTNPTVAGTHQSANGQSYSSHPTQSQLGQLLAAHQQELQSNPNGNISNHNNNNNHHHQANNNNNHHHYTHNNMSQQIGSNYPQMPSLSSSASSYQGQPYNPTSQRGSYNSHFSANHYQSQQYQHQQQPQQQQQHYNNNMPTQYYQYQQASQSYPDMQKAFMYQHSPSVHAQTSSSHSSFSHYHYGHSPHHHQQPVMVHSYGNGMVPYGASQRGLVPPVHASSSLGGGMDCYAAYQRGYVPPAHVSSSVPLEAIDENIKPMRLLKPVEGTGSWQRGRRYLISPAALAACPVSVVRSLSGNQSYSMQQKTKMENQSAFGLIDMGEAYITYLGENHHLSLGKWSSCRMVLRQNYLLEYDASASVHGIPRGFAHLQYSTAHSHSVFKDALELHFYASPCAKEDKRVLMIKVKNCEERDHWVKCLNDAAQLNLEDLYDFDTKYEVGRGRYVTVIPAQRKTQSFFQKGCDVDSSGTKENGNANGEISIPKQYDCALKIVNKNEFWRRVVNGQERDDALVREISVQSTLTSKCGRVPTFLKIRGLFETSDIAVMELELLQGKDLFEYIDTNVIKEEEAATIIRDILTSLDAMNRVGLVHRDIKPANILMCDKDQNGASVKVGDFGMSAFVEVNGLVQGRCGTPGYVAPEILKTEDRGGYDNKVDIFSAGVTLYVMLCGHEPFERDTREEMMDANKKGLIEFSEEDWSGYSDEVQDLIRKMTAPDPDARLTAKEALQHSWISKHAGDDKTLTDATLDISQSNGVGTNPWAAACTIS